MGKAGCCACGVAQVPWPLYTGFAPQAPGESARLPDGSEPISAPASVAPHGQGTRECCSCSAWHLAHSTSSTNVRKKLHVTLTRSSLLLTRPRLKSAISRRQHFLSEIFVGTRSAHSCCLGRDLLINNSQKPTFAASHRFPCASFLFGVLKNGSCLLILLCALCIISILKGSVFIQQN